MTKVSTRRVIAHSPAKNLTERPVNVNLQTEIAVSVKNNALLHPAK